MMLILGLYAMADVDALSLRRNLGGELWLNSHCCCLDITLIVLSQSVVLSSKHSGRVGGVNSGATT